MAHKPLGLEFIKRIGFVDRFSSAELFDFDLGQLGQNWSAKFTSCGAIIVLGMLALARRQVVTDRVDNLLKIGLGTYGKVKISS